MSKRNSNLYLQDIIDSAEAIFFYTRGVKFEAFCRDRMRYSRLDTLLLTLHSLLFL